MAVVNKLNLLNIKTIHTFYKDDSEKINQYKARKLKLNFFMRLPLKFSKKIKKIYSMKVLKLGHDHHTVYQKQLVCGL